MGEGSVWLGSGTDGACSRTRPGCMVALVPRRRRDQGRFGFGIISGGNQVVDEVGEFPQGLTTLFQRIAGNLATCKETCTKQICLDSL